MIESSLSQEDYVLSNTFAQNLERQQEFFDKFRDQLKYDRNLPFHDWNGFLFHYFNLRASIASLRMNPDTKDDPDFIELCNVWKNQRWGDIDIPRLKELYFKLNDKILFHENPIFNVLYGSFIKSVYMLFHDQYYTHSFFDID